VADLPAPFHLDTVRHVFQEYALATGRLRFRGRAVKPGAIRRTFLLTVEGERDDICSLGQTMAAHDLCVGLRSFMRNHYMQVGAGHYGVIQRAALEREHLSHGTGRDRRGPLKRRRRLDAPPEPAYCSTRLSTSRRESSLTGTGATRQISAAYSLIVRSDEKIPDRAALMIDIRVQRS